MLQRKHSELSVVLVNGLFHKRYLDRSDVQEHLGVGVLAAFLRQRGHKVRIIEPAVLGIDYQVTAEMVTALHPDVVGLSLTSTRLGYSSSSGVEQPVAEFLSTLRSLGFARTIVAGGIWPTLHCDQVLKRFPEVDFAIVGEGELALSDLCACLTQRQAREISGVIARSEAWPSSPTPATPIECLDRLPPMARDTLEVLQGQCRGQSAVVAISRGCAYTCTNCALPILGRDYGNPIPFRRYSPHYVVQEAMRLYREYGISQIVFIGDTFLGPRDDEVAWFTEVANGLIATGTALAYVTHIQPGNYAPETLELLARSGAREIIMTPDSVLDDELPHFGKPYCRQTIENTLAGLQRIGAEPTALSAFPVVVNLTPFHPRTTVASLSSTANWARERRLPPYCMLRRQYALDTGHVRCTQPTTGVGEQDTWTFEHKEIQTIHDTLLRLFRRVLPNRRALHSRISEASATERQRLCDDYLALDQQIYSEIISIVEGVR